MTLLEDDIKRLRAILRLAHAIERDHAPNARQQTLSSTSEPRLLRLKQLLKMLELSPNHDIRRLSVWSDHVHEQMSWQHFHALLVPLERFLQHQTPEFQFLTTHLDRDSDTPPPEGKHPAVIVLENLRSAFNVGAIFRSAECFAVEEVILTGFTPDPTAFKLARAAMGTERLVRWRHFSQTADAVRELRTHGYQILALETAQTSAPIQQYNLLKRTAFLFGNERFGLNPETLALADAIVEIPLRGRKNSLNVSNAVAICLFEFDRQYTESATNESIELKHD